MVAARLSPNSPKKSPILNACKGYSPEQSDSPLYGLVISTQMLRLSLLVNVDGS